MEKLEQAMRAIAAESEEAASLRISVHRNANVKAVINWVDGYLDKNPSDVLHLSIHRAIPGTSTTSVQVTKASVSSAIASGTLTGIIAGFGDAGQGSLPGQSRYLTRKYKCPTCGREITAIPLDGVEPPLCHYNHPPRHMVME